MRGLPGVMLKIYGILLQFYPASFRNEFEEQMLLDFSDMAIDAKSKGRFHFLLFCLRELVDLPVSLLRVHLKEGFIFRVLRSQPVNYGLRGAIGFSVVSFIAVIISDFVFWKLSYSYSGDSLIGYLQVYYYDLFHTEHGLELIWWFSPAFALLLTSLLFGIVIAILFANRSNYSRYIIVGMLGWFLHSAVSSILLNTLNMTFFLGTKHTTYLMNMMSILSGAFLGLLFIIAKSEKAKPVHWLMIGAFGYPLLIYFYIQLLYRFGIVETPRMFIALALLVIVYIGSVFMMAWKSENKPKIPWMVIIGSIGYPLYPYIGRFFPWQLIPSLDLPSVIYYTDPAYGQYILLVAIQSAIYAIPLGLLVGIALGFQKENSLPEKFV